MSITVDRHTGLIGPAIACPIRLRARTRYNGGVICRRVVVHGLVQGVFFRDTCRREAQRAGVGGWVRNRPDGTVEALFEGSEDDVRRMLEWARHGPPYARVDRVDVVEEQPTGHAGFVVTR